MKAGRKRTVLTPEQEDFIKANYPRMPASEIAKAIKVSITKVQTVVRGMGWKIKKEKAEIDWDKDTWSDTIHRELFPY